MGAVRAFGTSATFTFSFVQSHGCSGFRLGMAQVCTSAPFGLRGHHEDRRSIECPPHRPGAPLRLVFRKLGPDVHLHRIAEDQAARWRPNAACHYQRQGSGGSSHCSVRRASTYGKAVSAFVSELQKTLGCLALASSCRTRAQPDPCRCSGWRSHSGLPSRALGDRPALAYAAAACSYASALSTGTSC